MNRETMPEVVQARPVTGQGAADADLPGQSVKRTSDLSFIQPSIAARRKEVIGLPVREQTIPTIGVIGENLEAGSMERDQPRLAEFGIADRQNAVGPIDIGGSQIERFADAHTGHCQYAQQAVMRPRPQAVRGWQVRSE